MLVVMRSMFPKRTVNIALAIGFIVLFVGALLMGGQQAGVGNELFLLAMIPRHSRAILVCEESNITDPEIEELCDAIDQTQREEIATMGAMLED